MKVRKLLGDELKHVYAEKYSQRIIESEYEQTVVHLCPCLPFYVHSFVAILREVSTSLLSVTFRCKCGEQAALSLCVCVTVCMCV